MTSLPLLPILAALLFSPMPAEDPRVAVELDAAETPHLKKWGEDARDLVLEWHPRLVNLLPTDGFEPPRAITLRIRKSDEGIGWTSGTTITLSSHWLEKHPDDTGLVVHELVHAVQSYPAGGPSWVTEGIADYLRWAIYEGKAQDRFPRPKERRGYRQGYQVAAGFLLWLESTVSPGIVKKLNTAMRRGSYSDGIFEKEAGRPLDELWNAYAGLDAR